VALDRIWSVHMADGTVAPLWGSVMMASPLQTVPAPTDNAGLIAAPLSTQTVRFRAGVPAAGAVTVNTRIVDDRGEDWYVNETLRVGRERWLDVGMSTFPPDQRLPPYTDPQPGWSFRDVFGNFVQFLTVQSIDERYNRSYDLWWEVPTGVTGRGGARTRRPYVARLDVDDPEQQFVAAFWWLTAPAVFATTVRFQWRAPADITSQTEPEGPTTDLEGVLATPYARTLSSSEPNAVLASREHTEPGLRFRLYTAAELAAAGGVTWTEGPTS